MKFLAVVLITLPGLLLAQGPPANLTAVPVDAPDRDAIELDASAPDREQWERYFEQTMVRNVTRPAIYPVLPAPAARNGRAVIVVPGGGYKFVSMDSEGFRVADALAEEGYAAFVLKYRPMHTVVDPKEYMANLAAEFGTLGKRDLADHRPAVDDLAAAVRYLRKEAGEYGVDPARISVIGFSAGARTLIRLIEGRPEAGQVHDYALIYPPMVNPVDGGPRLPLFLAIAVDDPLFTQGGLTLIDAWLEESTDVEFHLYAGGGHGFGMRRIGATSDRWIEHYVSWLEHE